MSTPKTSGYLSKSEGKWRVIVGGLPICADKETEAEARSAATQGNVTLGPQMWDGDAGQWVPLGPEPRTTLTKADCLKLKAAQAQLAEVFGEKAIDLAVANQRVPDAVKILLQLYPGWRLRVTSGDFGGIAHGLESGSYKDVVVTEGADPSYVFPDENENDARVAELRRIFADDPTLGSVSDEDEFCAELAALEAHIKTRNNPKGNAT